MFWKFFKKPAEKSEASSASTITRSTLPLDFLQKPHTRRGFYQQMNYKYYLSLNAILLPDKSYLTAAKARIPWSIYIQAMYLWKRPMARAIVSTKPLQSLLSAIHPYRASFQRNSQISNPHYLFTVVDLTTQHSDRFINNPQSPQDIPPEVGGSEFLMDFVRHFAETTCTYPACRMSH